MKAGIDIYSSKETFEGLNINSYRAKVIEPLKQFKIGDFTILPFPLEHDVMNFGYLIQHGTDKIAFLTDTYYCKYKLSGVTCFMIEANYEKSILDKNFEEGLIDVSRRKRLVKSHFSLDNVKEFLKANDLSKVKDIILIHLSAGNSDPELFKSEIQRLTGKPVYVASKGLEIEL